MSTEANSLTISSAVFLGAVVLIGLPATALTMALFGTILETAGSTATLEEPVVSLVLIGVSLLIGLQLAYEAAALQLNGVEALDRGSRRATVARYAILSAGVGVALLATIRIGLSVLFATDERSLTIPGVLLAFAGLLVLLRGMKAFVDGYRGDETREFDGERVS
ncbi:hypothetical protein CV102_04670 [Natronococcus pandeyae]|uniref:DUF2975 domain-containing protein n=1 Tax=Natronococcus pandeyae TaxID=2055836 RepID=A0A8J8Q5X3_9EURY|nr:hypothetical protein [Natronococcus pandeyae]TYL39589.1 hypothetical protein CV102_04670 [Natronococcus pandeyae]